MKAIIEKPCDKIWDELAPNNKGAFCNTCNKTVIDFTSKTNNEIMDYLNANKGKNVCGRISFDKPKNGVPWKYIAILLTPFVWACSGFGRNQTILGKIITHINPLDTIHLKDSLQSASKMGKIQVTAKFIPMVDTVKVEQTNVPELLGEVDIQESTDESE
jgi:hypothetical protein